MRKTGNDFLLLELRVDNTYGSIIPINYSLCSSAGDIFRIASGSDPTIYHLIVVSSLDKWQVYDERRHQKGKAELGPSERADRL